MSAPGLILYGLLCGHRPDSDASPTATVVARAEGPSPLIVARIAARLRVEVLTRITRGDSRLMPSTPT